MVNITLVEVHFQDGSFSAALPFSGLTGEESAESEAEDEEAGAAAEESGSNKGKGLALLGVFAFLVVASAAVKYLSGDDEEGTPDVEIDTAPETPSAPAE
jgi:hypothetical protein